ncbi:MAG: GTPase HflX [Candidatus Krumholzibacteria bacterium]|nr:GTPase HflX [Candidatus Krumholzibacteria bacterium]MDH4336800.1 GTPase HflX [Candidatus Krumholzibacteria bacterium]MDH5269433.1 GTPase HflX [Candidatus Krumholzibacteria bacterium]
MKRAFEVITRARVERAYLVGVALRGASAEAAHEHLDELEQLAVTAGAEVVGRTVQGRGRIDATTYIGVGKVDELKQICDEWAVNLVVFDDDLSPAQAKNLEKILNVRVIDRTELILDIFARHAKSTQSKIQVELAQLEYSLPRLKSFWQHLERQAGGIGTRGPGETQLEVDRRKIYQRIGNLKRQLKKIDLRREMLRRARGERHIAALIGYTNAGKSTVMRRLTGAQVVVRDQLFATIDTTTRRMNGHNGNGNGNGNHDHDVLLIDTVGFIRKLPDHLRTSFKATLGDTATAELYLHVVDISHPAWEEQMEIADTTVASIDNPGVETIYVFNKVDQVPAEVLEGLQVRFPDAVFVSAASGEGMDALRERIDQFFYGRNVRVEVTLPAGDGKTISLVRRLLHDAHNDYLNDLCVLSGTIESKLMSRLEAIPGTRVRYLM